LRRVDGGLGAVEGVSAGGVKGDNYGVAEVEASGPAAAVFTKNRVKAAPLKVTRERLVEGRLDGVVANSGNANAFTGEQGLKDAEWMADLGGPGYAVASTGVIGRRIDRDAVESLYREVETSTGAEGSRRAAEAIMTTDTHPKEVAVEADGFTVAGIAKGAGMIEPQMGTMLAFLYTDADTDSSRLQRVLRSGGRDTFNMVTVDGETSTNDCALLTATCEREEPEEGPLEEAVEQVCLDLAKMIARDGEGSTKLIECRVTGAKTRGEAQRAAKAVARSPLVKTAFFGEDPNFGRIVAALGHSDASISESDMGISLGDVEVAREGEPLDFDHEDAKAAVEGDTVQVEASIGDGDHEATAYGCDLSPGYVDINATYAENH